MSAPVDITDRAPNPDLITMLEYQLERAKAGEIRSAVIVSAGRDNATGHSWALDGRTWRQPMLGELVFAQAEFAMVMSIRGPEGILNEALS